MSDDLKTNYTKLNEKYQQLLLRNEQLQAQLDCTNGNYMILNKKYLELLSKKGLNDMKYTEIFRLKEMLKKANIPFEYRNRGLELPYPRPEFHQIGYPNLNLDERVCSVVEGDRTYGADADRLEIMGLLTVEEYEDSCVLGGLTAEEVFERINKHYKGILRRR